MNTPSIAVRRTGEVDIVLMGVKGELLYYYLTPASAAWQTAIITQGPLASDPVILARGSGEVDIVVCVEGMLLYYYATAPGANWQTSILTPNGGHSTPTIAIHANGELDVAVSGPNQILSYYFVTGPGAPWWATTIAWTGTTGARPAIAVRNNDEVDIVVQGPDNELLYFYQISTGIKNRFGPWQSSTIAPAGTIFSAPAVAVGTNGRAHIVAQGRNGELLYFTATPGSPWQAVTIAPAGSAFLPPAIVVRDDGEVDVVVKGPHNELVYYYMPPPNFKWQSSLIATLSQTVRSTYTIPAMALSSTGEMYVVVFGPTDNQIQCFSATPGSQWRSTMIG